MGACAWPWEHRRCQVGLISALVVLQRSIFAEAEVDRKESGECKPKNQDPNGRWTGSIAPLGQYTLVCDPGYAVDDKPNVSLSCMENLQWPADPWCENIDDCAKLVYACGPAGLCVDHKGTAECLCERGAAMHNTSIGEAVCYFKNQSRHCGGRNCGAHGICINLKQFQDSFDSGDGKESFRCSCEHGFIDDGTSCVPVNCGLREDSLGTWSGTSAYLGEYTLECDSGAFLWGGSQQAITLTCPGDGVWKSHPVCRSPEQLARHAQFETFCFYFNICMALVCIVCAAIAAGLTMGLVSLDDREMDVIYNAQLRDCSNLEEEEELERNQEAARQIKPLLKDHHRLLVTLLLLNAIANEALPIFLDDLMPPWLALLVSVTFVLLCGEIVPSAIFTGPMQLTIAAKVIPCVECLQWFFSSIARPIAKGLDTYLPKETDQLYTRPEIRAVLCLHCQGGDPRVSSREPRDAEFGTSRTLMSGSPTSTRVLLEDELKNMQRTLPLNPAETNICLNIMALGEKKVYESAGFRSLRICSNAFYAVGGAASVESVVHGAARARKQMVIVFRGCCENLWPAQVTEADVYDILGVVPLSELLSVDRAVHISSVLPRPGIPKISIDDKVAWALSDIYSRGYSPGKYAAVVQRSEFTGIFDCDRAMFELLGDGSGLPKDPGHPKPLGNEVSRRLHRRVELPTTPKPEKPEVFLRRKSALVPLSETSPLQDGNICIDSSASGAPVFISCSDADNNEHVRRLDENGSRADQGEGREVEETDIDADYVFPPQTTVQTQPSVRFGSVQEITVDSGEAAVSMASSEIGHSISHVPSSGTDAQSDDTPYPDKQAQIQKAVLEYEQSMQEDNVARTWSVFTDFDPAKHTAASALDEI